MRTVIAAATPLVYVTWDCRRCGHRNGMARTTVPIDVSHEAMREAVFVELRRKLQRVHQKSGCIATLEDFVIRRFDPPPGRTVAGLLDTR